jgi:hypothetical protein
MLLTPSMTRIAKFGPAHSPLRKSATSRAVWRVLPVCFCACIAQGPLFADPAAEQPPGTWGSVTPPDVNLDFDWPTLQSNFGAQAVVVDPVRSSDLYAFFCYQGVWRSTDYGLTWAKVSVGANGDVLDSGRPWAVGIDSSTSRDPADPPTLYTGFGYGSAQGFFRSRDGGRNWERFDVPQGDVYALAVDPSNGAHLLGGLHLDDGLIESTNGGETWQPLAVSGSSLAPYFAGAVWLAQAEVGCSACGLWRSTDQGAMWKQVESVQRAQGEGQLFDSGGGVLYLGGVYGSQGWGLYRSGDSGQTWANLLPDNVVKTGVIGTERTLYAWGGGAVEVDPAFITSPRSDGVTWTPLVTPAEMRFGPKQAAVTRQGSHAVLVTASWRGGLWRYVEP